MIKKQIATAVEAVNKTLKIDLTIPLKMRQSSAASQVRQLIVSKRSSSTDTIIEDDAKVNTVNESCPKAFTIAN